jgi:hypothetical protein
MVMCRTNNEALCVVLTRARRITEEPPAWPGWAGPLASGWSDPGCLFLPGSKSYFLLHFQELRLAWGQSHTLKNGTAYDMGPALAALSVVEILRTQVRRVVGTRDTGRAAVGSAARRDLWEDPSPSAKRSSPKKLATAAIPEPPGEQNLSVSR